MGRITFTSPTTKPLPAASSSGPGLLGGSLLDASTRARVGAVLAAEAGWAPEAVEGLETAEQAVRACVFWCCVESA